MFLGLEADFGEWLILSLLALIMGFTLIYQLFTLKMQRWRRRWDIFLLLPSYHFFITAPRVFYLSYAFVSNPKDSDWHEVALTRKFRWYQGIWNPEKLPLFVTNAILENFVLSFEQFGNTALSKQSQPYVLLHHFLRSQTGVGTEMIVFRVVERVRDGSGGSTVVTVYEGEVNV